MLSEWHKGCMGLVSHIIKALCSYDQLVIVGSQYVWILMCMNLRLLFHMRNLEEVRRGAIEELFIEKIRPTIRMETEY